MVQIRCNSSLNESSGIKEGQKSMNSVKNKRTFTGVSGEELLKKAPKFLACATGSSLVPSGNTERKQNLE